MPQSKPAQQRLRRQSLFSDRARLSDTPPHSRCLGFSLAAALDLYSSLLSQVQTGGTQRSPRSRSCALESRRDVRPARPELSCRIPPATTTVHSSIWLLHRKGEMRVERRRDLPGPQGGSPSAL